MNRLIVIPPSHYCEKARWALRLAQIDFVEEAHPPLFHIPAVKKAGGLRSTPTLVCSEGTFSDSSHILEWIHGLPVSKWKPYGKQVELQQDIKEWEQLSGNELGSHTRRSALYYLFQHPKSILLPALIDRAPISEQKWMSRLYPMIKVFMKKSMRIDDEGARRSKVKVSRCFDRVIEQFNAQKERGEGYLVAKTMSAADLSFASLAAPVVLPDEYGALLPKLSDLLVSTKQMIQEYRAHPAGQFALRIYQELNA